MTTINLEINQANSKQKSLIGLIEEKFLAKSTLLNFEKEEIKSGDILRIGYKIPEGDKERIQYYEGLVISIKNRTLSRTFKIRRIVQGIGVEQTFLLNSPKIITLVRKQSSKVRRAKLYFIRNLKGKATRLKVKHS
jgi:large subunit ribosomal protein L19